MSEFQRQFGNAAVPAMVLVVIVALLGIMRLWVARLLTLDRLCLVLSAAAVAGIAVLTLGPWSSGSDGGRSVSLIPFEGIATARTNVNAELGALNLFGNIALFVPLGLLLQLSQRLRVHEVVAAGIATSVTIEVSQFILGDRAADIDDVILNGTGVVLGATSAIALVWFLRAVQTKASLTSPGHEAPPSA